MSSLHWERTDDTDLELRVIESTDAMRQRLRETLFEEQRQRWEIAQQQVIEQDERDELIYASYFNRQDAAPLPVWVDPVPRWFDLIGGAILVVLGLTAVALLFANLYPR